MPSERRLARARTGELNDGYPLWRHTCGHVEAFLPEELSEILGGCDACESGSNNPKDWQKLYVYEEVKKPKPLERVAMERTFDQHEPPPYPVDRLVFASDAEEVDVDPCQCHACRGERPRR